MAKLRNVLVRAFPTGPQREVANIREQVLAIDRTQDVTETTQGVVRLRALERALSPPLNGKKFAILAGVLLVPLAVILLGLIPGWTQSAYVGLWMNTTGRPFTHIMREQPWLLPLLALPIIVVPSLVLALRWRYRLLLVVGSGLLGYLGGHVFW